MVKKEKQKKRNGLVNCEILGRAAELERLFRRAVQEAQEENRRFGIQNWYSINGVIISDQEIAEATKRRELTKNE